jgi:hypothetical protein
VVNVLTSAYKSIVVETPDGELTVSEGMTIRFTVNAGEEVKGVLNKISGKEEKTKLQITPLGTQKEEIWIVALIDEGSLSVIE